MATIDNFLEDKCLYNGTKADFATLLAANQTALADKVIFITGGTDNAKESCIWAQGTYFADINELIKAIAYVKGVRVGGTDYIATEGGSTIGFVGGDNINVTVENGSVTMKLSAAFIQSVSSNTQNLMNAVNRIANIEADYLKAADKTALNNLITALSGRVDQVEDDIEGVEGRVGELANLETTDKSSIVAAINEALGAIEVGGTGSKVTMTGASGGESDNYSKRYTFYQGAQTTANVVGVVDIPKDMVVQSGAVEVNPTGQAAGTYIVLTLANATSDKLYINVGTLVDIYTAAQNAAKVQITINSSTREISATLVAKSVTATELADNAVTTNKIAPGIVTMDRLNQSVQNAINGALKSVAFAIATGEYIAITKDTSSAATTPKYNVSLTMGSIPNNTEGLAEAQDVKAYIDARVGWKVIS